MVTLLEALTRQNVPVNSTVIPGPNTVVDDHVLVHNWRPWLGFDYPTLTAIFRKELDKEYTGSQEQAPLSKDITIRNEESFEDLLRRFISPTVNYGLNGHHFSCHFGRGSRCRTDKKYIPDWSVISDQFMDASDTYVNILPGDTKLSAKWWPTMITDNYPEWQKVVEQIATYMTANSSRYGFLITDACLVVLRLTRYDSGTGLAARRTRRTQPIVVDYTSSHQRQASDFSMSSHGGSLYADEDERGWDYYDPEYAVIPWRAHGVGQLTVKLALWCLAMMAANGGNHIDFQYPELDTWYSDGKYVVNYASGMKRSTLPKGHRLEGSNEGGQSTRGASTPMYGYETGESSGTQTTDSGGDYPMSAAESGQEYEDDQYVVDNENDTEVDISTKRKRRKIVRIETHFFSNNLYFRDAKGKKCDTSKNEWQKVPGGYELETAKYVYFTEKFL